MSNGPENPRRRESRALRDAAIIAAMVAGVLLITLALDVAEGFHTAVDSLSPGQARLFDNLLLLLPLLALALGIFSLARWRELNKEVEARRRVEAALEESERTYFGMVEASPEAILVHEDGRVVFANERAARLLAAPSPEHILHKPVIEVVHPDYRATVAAWIDGGLGAKPAPLTEERFVSLDGRTVDVEVTDIPVTFEGKPARQLIVRDITDRKRAEARVKEAEEKYRTLVETVPAMTYVWDTADEPGTTASPHVSPQVHSLLGFTKEEWESDPMRWHKQVHPDDREGVLAEWERTAGAGKRFSAEYRVFTKDGHLVWIRDDATVVATTQRGTWILQGVMFDITKRKEAEEELARREAVLETVSFAADRFLKAATWSEPIDEILARLGDATKTGRICLFANSVGPDGSLLRDMVNEWTAEGVPATIGRPGSHGSPYAAGYERHAALLGRREPICGNTAEFPAGERADLKEAGVVSCAAVPVFAGEHWWGYLRHDDCRAERDWSRTEIDALLVAADTIGAAIGREQSRVQLEQSEARSGAVLEAVHFAANRFLKTASWKESIDEVLTHLGKAIETSRISVFENFVRTDGELSQRMLYERCEDGIASTIGLDNNADWPYSRGYSRYVDILSRGEAIHGITRRDFSGFERDDMLSEDILSAAVVPIFVDDEWWGYVGYDECRIEREWTRTEMDALHAAADTLGAAIGREKAQARLLEAEERYRTLVERLPLVTYVDDVDTDLTTYMSPQIEALIGYTADEWLADQELWYRILHPDDREWVIAEDRRTTVTGEPLSIEYRFIARDGRVVWVRDESVLLRDEHGEPISWQGLYQDITERKEAEEQLREAERRFRTLVEQLPAVPYADTLVGDDTIYISPQVEKLLGYSPQEWIDDPLLWERLLHPDDRDWVVAASERADETGEPFVAEYRILTRDGRLLWVLDNERLVRGEEGTPLYWQGLMQDITARKRAEARLRQAEERFRALVEHIPAVLYLEPIDGSLPTVYINPQIETVLGVTAEEYTADPDLWYRMLHPEDRETANAGWKDSLARGEPWTAEYRMITKDGRNIWIREETVILQDVVGEPGLVQGVMLDITERKHLEEALRENERRERKAAEQLRALDEMKNTFLAAVSHELRSPLTSILGLSVTLEQQDLSSADRADLTARLSANAKKLDRLLGDLLDIDRLSRGIVSPEYRMADVSDLLRRTVANLEGSGKRTIEVRAEPVEIPVDPAKVERIVENLLANAIRHTQEPVKIWARVQRHEGGALISVEDDGPGVPEEIREAIFQPFRQGPARSRHSPGTGIGLSLVSRFAELHGGRAWVEEREGGGAAFRVFLPGTKQASVPLNSAEAG